MKGGIDFSAPVIFLLIIYGVVQILHIWGLEGIVGDVIGWIALIIGLIGIFNMMFMK